MLGLRIEPGGGPRPRAGWTLDFVRGRHAIDGRRSPDLDDWLAAVGATYQRASAGYGRRADRSLVPFAANRPRVTDAGLLLEAAGENRLLNSSFAGAGSWTFHNCAPLTTPAAAPDGGSGARRVTVTATGPALAGQSIVAPAIGAGLVHSLHVRPGGSATPANAFGVRNATTGQNLLFVHINLATGALTYSVGSTGAEVSAGPGDWLRLKMTVTTGVTAGDLLTTYLGLQGAASAAGADVDVWGPQLATAAAAGTPVQTTTAVGVRAADRMDLPLAPWVRRIRAAWGEGQVSELSRAGLTDPAVLDLAGNWPWRGAALKRVELTP